MTDVILLVGVLWLIFIGCWIGITLERIADALERMKS